MNPEFHPEAFEERKETVLKWALEVRGLEKSQRIVGDNASRAITELLSAYLHKTRKVDVGFQLNHTWFKSEKVFKRLPNFEKKTKIVNKMIRLEKLCEHLSYGAPKPVGKVKEALELFEVLERAIKGML
jgi:hypothetical protein